MDMRRVLALPPNRDFSRFCGENCEFRGILKKNMNSADFYRGRGFLEGQVSGYDSGTCSSFGPLFF